MVKPTPAQSAGMLTRDATPGTITDTVQTVHGIERPVMSQMTAARPTSGWTGVITSGRVTISVAGSDPASAVNDAVHKLSAMKLSMPLRDIWLRLNLQWMQRTADKSHFTPISTIANMVASLDQTPPAVETAKLQAEIPKAGHGPAEWGHIGWSFMGLWLARGVYDPNSFRLILDKVLVILDETLSPLTGCEECRGHFDAELQRLELHPEELKDLTSARMWLWKFHNSVNLRLGKPQMSWQDAVAANFWN